MVTRCSKALVIIIFVVFRLGAFNTALVRAYCKFDQRLAILGTFVKLWTRERAIPRIRLNSYAQSLMVIYFLQRVSPPVLPCLQQTEGWPKNLKRYKGSPLQVKKVWSKLIAPWDVGFASPQSLLPSTNTDSPGMCPYQITEMLLWVYIFPCSYGMVHFPGSYGMVHFPAHMAWYIFPARMAWCIFPLVWHGIFPAHMAWCIFPAHMAWLFVWHGGFSPNRVYF